MSIVSVLVGSTRVARQGVKVSNYVSEQLKKRGHTVHLIDPLKYPSLRLFEERFRYLKDPNEGKNFSELNLTSSKDLVQVQKLLDQSDAFIGVTPEHNYGASAAILQTMDVFFNEFKFKPMGIVG
jgi:NAD(P)H-dependent FMN reductase